MQVNTNNRLHRRGATIVETAFVLLIALTITFALFDYCRYFMLAELVNNACREGARQAVVSTNLQNTSTIQNLVISYLANQSLKNTSGVALSASDVTIMQVNPATGAASSDSNWYDASFGSSIMVQVKAEFTPFFPTMGFLPSTVSITGCSVMSSEAN